MFHRHFFAGTVGFFFLFRFLDAAWETLRLHTEMSALGHLESAQQFSDESAFIMETNVKFREERKNHEETVRCDGKEDIYRHMTL